MSVPTSQEEYDVEETVAALVEALDRPRRGSGDPSDGGYVDPGVLPSFGSEYHDCGDQKVKHFCPDCGGTVPLGRNCLRAECPNCAPYWVVDKAETQLARIQQVARRMYARYGVPIKAHHVSMSQPEDWYLAASDPLDRTFQCVGEALEPMHAEGIVIAHGYRGRDGDDRDAWKGRLFNDRPWDDVRGELRPSGHFHCVLLSPFVPGGEITKQVEEETGWVIERIRGLGSIEARAEALTYALSHVNLQEQNGQMQAQYRRFGEMMWDDSINVYNHTEREAEQAVRSVAPRLLGVKPNNLRCSQPVPDESDQSEYAIDRSASYHSSSSDDTDDDSDDAEGSVTDDADTGANSSSDVDQGDLHEDTGPMCRGTLRPISEAERYLADDEWVEEALYAEQLRRELEEWIALTETDRPPPVAEVWAD